MVSRNTILYSLVIVLGTSLLTVFLLNPFWQTLDLHVPGEPGTKVDHTAPVDAIFYIRNAENGYQWKSRANTSFWFHPLVALLIRANLFRINLNYWFYTISLLFAIFALLLIRTFTNYLFDCKIPEWQLLLIPLLPGGLIIGTSNAEIPSLFLNTALLLSIYFNLSRWAIVLFGGLAILAKPNALYLIPLLFVNVVFGWIKKHSGFTKNNVVAILSILIGWIIWILIVDVGTGEFGTYFDARKAGSGVLLDGPFSLMIDTARTFLNSNDSGEKLKYLTSFAIPLVDLWILIGIKIKSEGDRLAQIAGILAVMVVNFLINNPNKVIVYTLTLPIHISVGLAFLNQNSF